MQVESFFFTRNQRRDFTAFVRPASMSNRDVSAIASALNNINDVERLSRSFPSLYGFALVDTVLLIRHYDSGRRHAGRPIGVVEGMTVRGTWARHFALAAPYLVAHQDDILNVADHVGDIETLNPIQSPVRELPDRSAAIDVQDRRYIEEFLARRVTDRLIVPFDRAGLLLMVGALAERRFLSPLSFAFGTNGDVIGAFAERGIDFDIIGYFNAEQACFRNRETGQKTGDVALPVVDDVELDDTRPNPAVQAALIEDTSGVMSLRGRVQPIPRRESVAPVDLPPVRGADELPESERMLTMREARRQAREEAAANVPEETQPSGFDPFGVLRKLVRLLTGKSD